MKKLNRNYLILLVLAGIFAFPGIAAYFLYNNPQWLGATPTNKGKLLNPPILTAQMDGKPKWRLVLWTPDECAQSCQQQIDKLGRIRLALGRRLYEVEEVLLKSDKLPDLSGELLKSFEEQDVLIETIQSSLLPAYPQVYISNPENYLVLAYELNAKPEDIFHDLKHLLSSTEKKSG